MEIKYKSNNLKRICEKACKAQKEYGENMAEKIHMRIDQMKSVNTIEEMLTYRIGRCHQLNGQRNGQYAVDLVHPYRMVFEKYQDNIKIVKIIEIVDYH